MITSKRDVRSGRASFSIISILAVACALGSFWASGGLGLLLAVLAIGGGIIGVLLALLPGTRGGFVSVFAVMAGLIGIGAALFKIFNGPSA